ASGGIGGAVVPLFTGWWMDRFHAAAAPPMLTVLATFVLAIMLLLVALSRRATNTDASQG
ncbi:MAG: hypothetical protein K0R75_179, partial [Paenibacillaceae bacterium]|nr:hypothetical protein [Paenibacillaceae bacterium]